MKISTIMVTLLFAPAVFANVVSWGSQKSNNIYKSVKDLTLYLDNKEYIISKGTSFELFEVSRLSMIKVYLHKYKIDSCEASLAETDLELIKIKQLGKTDTSVGVNLAKECSIEVLIDMNDYQTLSFLKLKGIK